MFFNLKIIKNLAAIHANVVSLRKVSRNKEQLEVINEYSFGERFTDGTMDIPDERFLDVLGHIWRHYNYSIDMGDVAGIDDLGLDMDILIGEHVFRK